jgi:predicted ArsR family transcriptional regulator
MSSDAVTSDTTIIDLLRKHQSMTVSDLAAALDVTATAVRQRLSRLMGQGCIERSAARAGRGRPSHHYALTAKGRRKAGSNFGDLAVALWREVVAIEDPSVRRALIQRVSRRLADAYEGQVQGDSVEERMEQLAKVFRDRRVSFSVENHGETPRLTALSCPYPDLAKADRNICAMERQLLTRLLGTRLRVQECRLDGDNCCSFEPEGPRDPQLTELSEPTREVAAGG